MRSRGCLLVVLVVLAACARVVHLDEVGVSEIAHEQYSLTQWDAFREYLGRVQHGAGCKQSEFDYAISFFETVTDLEAGLTGAYGGRVLDREQLANAMKRWDRWYADRQAAEDSRGTPRGG